MVDMQHISSVGRKWFHLLHLLCVTDSDVLHELSAALSECGSSGGDVQRPAALLV